MHHIYALTSHRILPIHMQACRSQALLHRSIYVSRRISRHGLPRRVQTSHASVVVSGMVVSSAYSCQLSIYSISSFGCNLGSLLCFVRDGGRCTFGDIPVIAWYARKLALCAALLHIHQSHIRREGGVAILTALLSHYCYLFIYTRCLPPSTHRSRLCLVPVYVGIWAIDATIHSHEDITILLRTHIAVEVLTPVMMTMEM